MDENTLSPELAAIADFIRHTLPFSALPEDELEAVVRKMEIGYFRNGHVFDQETPEQGLRILRSGAVELRNQEDELLDRLAEGESFNLSGLLQEEPGIRAVLIEDSLLYFLPREVYQDLRSRHRDFDRFFHGQRSRRLFRATRRMVSPGEMLHPLKGLMATDLVTTPVNATVSEVAQIMARRRVSSALVLDKDQLVGIVTDRDLRTRVLARGRDGRVAIHEIMSPNPITVEEKGTLFDATLLMTRNGLHHLPVQRGNQTVGILTTSDLITARQNDPVYLVQRLSRQECVDGIKQVLRDVPDFLVHWSDDGVPADQVSHILTAISDTVTRRLIELAMSELGEAPVPFCWLGFGSQARAEQLLNADQDNALIISDQVTEEQLDYFSKLTEQVCTGLDSCGYVFCPGDVMAQNPYWRKTLRQWRDTVDRWITSPTPQSVMKISIAFDIRGIYGDMELASQLQSHMLHRVRESTIFQAALASNVLNESPPLGIFRRFVVERDGEHKDNLNLKKRGILPIVEIVRLRALSAGISEVNTLERLQLLVRGRHMSRYDSRNLQDALRFLMQVRLQVQANQISEGEPLSNHCNPRKLPKLAREQLRDAFRIVDTAQKSIRTQYRQGLG